MNKKISYSLVISGVLDVSSKNEMSQLWPAYLLACFLDSAVFAKTQKFMFLVTGWK